MNSSLRPYMKRMTLKRPLGTEENESTTDKRLRHEIANGGSLIVGMTGPRSKDADQRRKKVIRRQETKSMKAQNQEKSKKKIPGKETKESNTKTIGSGECPKTATRAQ